MKIALVAHDGRKQELIEWVKYNYKELSSHTLYATGTTGKMIKDIDVSDPTMVPQLCSDGVVRPRISASYKPFQNSVTCLLSGPLGGDQQIGAMIAEGKIDMLIFFCDNLIVQGHQNDVSALSRLASLYNIAFATNRTTADMLITSKLFDNKEYKRIIPSAIDNYKNRTL